MARLHKKIDDNLYYIEIRWSKPVKSSKNIPTPG